MDDEPSAGVPLVGGVDGKVEAEAAEVPVREIYEARERAHAGLGLVRRQRSPDYGPTPGVAS
jgi:hypothetical protein